MFQALGNVIGFICFIAILAVALWVSAFFVVILLGLFAAAYIAMRIWAYLVKKQIVNPRPGYPMQDDGIIDAEYTRVDVRIEEKKD